MHTLILVSGMPATGKTTFAQWLSQQLHAPLVCYDHIKEKYLSFPPPHHGNLPLAFFWFHIEAIMQSGSPLIAEYFFTNQMKETLDPLVEKYGYKTVNIHMDAPVDLAYQRFCQRNKDQPEGLRPTDISFDQFATATQQNRDFSYGDQVIPVDTSVFTPGLYPHILERIAHV